MHDDIARIHALSTTPRYNIKVVVQQTKLNISTLRAWEQRYGLPAPTRSPHGHRLYSARDVAIIQWLKRSTEKGMAISQAVAMLREAHDLDLADLVEPLPEPLHTLGHLRDQLLAALLEANLRQAHLVLNLACALFPLDQVIVDLLQPTHAAVVDRATRRDIGVMAERLAENFMRQRLFALMQVHAPFSRGPRLICACAPEEQQELDMLMLALLMEQHGWETIYLGTDLPQHGLAESLVRFAPAVVYLSVTLAENASAMLDVCKIIEPLEQRHLLLTYGGRLFQHYPEFQKRLPGTFLCSGLRQAASALEDLGQQIDYERWVLRERDLARRSE